MLIILPKPLNPEDVSKVAIPAGKQFLAEVDFLVNSDDNFIIETTLSGKTLIKKIQKAKKNGFITRLVYLWITSPELCDFRVKGRVASGGHNIPIADITRRYQRSLKNFPKYLEVIDECSVYLADGAPIQLFRKTLDNGEEIIHRELYKSFQLSLNQNKN